MPGMPDAAFAASPKQSCSPARVRHNPYAPSPGSPAGTPVDHGGMSQHETSFAESFASMSVPPTTPPTAPGKPQWHPPCASPSAPLADYTQREYTLYAAGLSVAEPALDAAGQQESYYSDVPAYDSVDPNVAVAMYNAASAAANAAAMGNPYTASLPRDDMRRGSQHVYAATRGGGRPLRAGSSADGTTNAIPRFEELQAACGTLSEQARTATGSSFIQSAVKESQDPRCLELVWSELCSQLGELLLDPHGCYVIKTLLERLPPVEVNYVLRAIAADEQLGYSVCTHSLHTRRVVQYIIESIDGEFLCDLMARHCAEVAMTQQGCIVMQRAMDHAPVGAARDALLQAISKNLVAFSKDPFANYVVQHLMEVGERVETAGAMWKAFQGRLVELACNKFASNVVEKCLFHCTAEVQHEMLLEMYSVPPQMLYNMLQDSFGNYIIQSSIALATFRDVGLIDERLRPVLAHTPYGYKIEARLDRRLKGKPVTSRAGPSGVPVASTGAGGRGRGRRSDKAQPVPPGEKAW